MAIKIGYEPVASIGPAAYAGGLGEYRKWLAEQQQQERMAAQSQAEAAARQHEQIDANAERQAESQQFQWESARQGERFRRESAGENERRQIEQEQRHNQSANDQFEFQVSTKAKYLADQIDQGVLDMENDPSYSPEERHIIRMEAARRKMGILRPLPQPKNNKEPTPEEVDKNLALNRRIDPDHPGVILLRDPKTGEWKAHNVPKEPTKKDLFVTEYTKVLHEKSKIVTSLLAMVDAEGSQVYTVKDAQAQADEAFEPIMLDLHEKYGETRFPTQPAQPAQQPQGNPHIEGIKAMAAAMKAQGWSKEAIILGLREFEMNLKAGAQ